MKFTRHPKQKQVGITSITIVCIKTIFINTTIYLLWQLQGQNDPIGFVRPFELDCHHN